LTLLLLPLFLSDVCGGVSAVSAIAQDVHILTLCRCVSIASYSGGFYHSGITSKGLVGHSVQFFFAGGRENRYKRGKPTRQWDFGTPQKKGLRQAKGGIGRIWYRGGYRGDFVRLMTHTAILKLSKKIIKKNYQNHLDGLLTDLWKKKNTEITWWIKGGKSGDKTPHKPL